MPIRLLPHRLVIRSRPHSFLLASRSVEVPVVSPAVVCHLSAVVGSRHRVTRRRDAACPAVPRTMMVVTPMAMVALSGLVVMIRELRTALPGVRLVLRLLHLQAALPWISSMC